MGNAVKAQGCDRHLLGLRLLAAEDGTHDNIPLFMDAALSTSSSHKLSTSNISGSGFDAGVGSEWYVHTLPQP